MAGDDGCAAGRARVSHRVLLENDRVRVPDVVIEPRAREPEHTHQAPSVNDHRLASSRVQRHVQQLAIIPSSSGHPRAAPAGTEAIRPAPPLVRDEEGTPPPEVPGYRQLASISRARATAAAITAIAVDAQRCAIRERHEHLRAFRVMLIDPDMDLAEQAAQTLLPGCHPSLNLCPHIGRKVIHAARPACVTDPAPAVVRCAHADSVLVPVLPDQTRRVRFTPPVRKDRRAINVPLARVISGQYRPPPVITIRRSEPVTGVCGTPSKLVMRVRFPSPAPAQKPRSACESEKPTGGWPALFGGIRATDGPQRPGITHPRWPASSSFVLASAPEGARPRALQLDPGRAAARDRQPRGKPANQHQPDDPMVTGPGHLALLTSRDPMGDDLIAAPSPARPGRARFEEVP
jgi:hypothetical protein